jgi:hypothetical protein
MQPERKWFIGVAHQKETGCKSEITWEDMAQQYRIGIALKGLTRI